jgi:thiamine biosynthesis lipoprotein
LVEQSQEISRASDGAFDITVAPLVNLWGFGPRPALGAIPQAATASVPAIPDHLPPTAAELATAKLVVGWQKVEPSVEAATLRKVVPDVTLDLASIAEGWAVDELSSLIERRGQEHFLVEAGGELRARGRWRVGIERPARVVALCDQALSTSGTYRQRWNDAGRQRSHIIDPRTGEPVGHDTVSVTVIHPSCALADAWSTALLVLGAEEGLAVAEREHLAAAFVVEKDAGISLHLSSTWQSRE